MTARRPRLLAGGALGAALGLLLARRRRRRGANPEIRGELLEKAREWAGDAALPDHVREVARRILDADRGPADVAAPADHLHRRRIRRH